MPCDYDNGGRAGSSDRSVPPNERLALALELHEFSCDVAREGIRHQHPGITDAEVEQLLRQRLELITIPSS
jgi:hypothetical protein